MNMNKLVLALLIGASSAAHAQESLTKNILTAGLLTSVGYAMYASLYRLAEHPPRDHSVALDMRKDSLSILDYNLGLSKTPPNPKVNNPRKDKEAVLLSPGFPESGSSLLCSFEQIDNFPLPVYTFDYPEQDSLFNANLGSSYDVKTYLLALKGIFKNSGANIEKLHIFSHSRGAGVVIKSLFVLENPQDPYSKQLWKEIGIDPDNQNDLNLINTIQRSVAQGITYCVAPLLDAPEVVNSKTLIIKNALTDLFPNWMRSFCSKIGVSDIAAAIAKKLFPHFEYEVPTAIGLLRRLNNAAQSKADDTCLPCNTYIHFALQDKVVGNAYDAEVAEFNTTVVRNAICKQNVLMKLQKTHYGPESKDICKRITMNSHVDLENPIILFHLLIRKNIKRKLDMALLGAKIHEKFNKTCFIGKIRPLVSNNQTILIEI